ncbi:hypothetical protein IW152_002713 [Coemansia sp. BCRC 34962]|nr:hypothetical protein IW152_002713 [Coemansia sp. BCRC 34962]
MDQQQQQQQQQQDISGLFLKDLNTGGNGGDGTFPFPLGDQASLFNFHTPAGLGLGPLYLNNDGTSNGVGQLLNSVLYDMSGIQQIDGLHHGTQIASDDMGLFLAAATAADEMRQQQQQPSSSTPAARIDQACRMCRRRKVKCDGLRPTCTFCQTKGFECAYEPAPAAGARKRRRRQTGSEAQNDLSSVASLAERAAVAAAAAMAAVEMSDSDSDGDSGSSREGDSGDLEALSRRQIAMPESEDVAEAQEVASSADDSMYLEWYFAYFHPQQPILHRATFERDVHSGKVSAVLWLAVRAIAARYGPRRAGGEQPFEYGRRFAERARALLATTQEASLEVMQAAFLVSEHQFGVGDWVGGSSYWGTAARMFSQQQLHALDEAFQFPAYTSHLGLHESAISPLTCQQSPAHYAAGVRRPALSSAAWIVREQQRRLRWALFDAERTHTLAGGAPPLVTLDAGWVHMPCSDALWESSAPRRAAEHERLLLHMGRYYVDSGGSLRIDVDSSQQPPSHNRVASMLVRVRRRKNRMHLRAHTAVVVGQLARTRLALFRLFFPSRWPSQLQAEPVPAPVMVAWDERLRRARAAVAEIDGKLAQWRVYLESMFPLRDYEEEDGDAAIHAERIEYANYRLLLATLLAQNRAVLLQLHACLERRAKRIQTTEALPALVRPNQPPPPCMRALRRMAREAWAVVVRQACEVADLLQSHWLVTAPPDPKLRLLVRSDWHSPAAISAKLNADANLRRFPPDPESGLRRPEQTANAAVFFSHSAPPHPLLVANRRLLDRIICAASASAAPAAELPLACSLNANIHIETNASAAANDAAGCSNPTPPPPDFGDDDSADFMEPFRRQLPGTSYFIFVAAKTLIMYLHHAKMSAYLLARRNSSSSSSTAPPLPHDVLLPSESVSIDGDHHVDNAARPCALPDFAAYAPPGDNDEDNDADFASDLSPPPELRTLADIRRMQDRLEVVMTALRLSQRHWMPVDYFTLCARKIRNMSLYGPWSIEDPVSSDPLAELAAAANDSWATTSGKNTRR